MKKLDLKKELPELKKLFPYLREVNSQSLQAVIEHLDDAFNNFFRTGKGYPNFKKKSNKNSFKVKLTNGNVKLTDTTLKIPKFKEFNGKN